MEVVAPVSHLVSLLLALPPVLVLLAAFVLPALEASALVGLVVPGETAVFVAGLVAHGGHLPLWAAVLAGVGGAVVGDQVGYRLGRRLGPALVARLPRRLRRTGSVVRAVDLVGRRGGWAVLAGRWTALLRALVPGLAGAGGMSTRTFTLFNVLGGLTWATTIAVLGDAAGTAYTQVLSTLGRAGQVGLGVVVLAVVVVLVVRHVRGARRSGPTPTGPDLDGAGPVQTSASSR